MRVRVIVMLKNGVLDPQGAAVHQALGAMGIAGIDGVRQGKVIELDIAQTDRAAAEATAREAADKLLVNGVIESYSIEMDEA